MNKRPFSDGVTDDTSFKKVFSQPFTAWCAGVRCSLYIIYLYCYKCHKCHCPLFAGVSSVTLRFPSLSSVTTFPIL